MRATFVLPTRPVYTVVFDDGFVPISERSYIVLDGVRYQARVDVKWTPVDVTELPEFSAWAKGLPVRMVERRGNIETWEGVE